MRGNELLNKMELIDPAFIDDADKTSQHKRKCLKKQCIAAACLCLAFILSVPAAVAYIPEFYDTLYAFSPSAAQLFKPVQLSCQDNGIRMEVKATYIREETAEIYISMHDMESSRLDETTDLFDSYSINTPFDCISHCRMTGYDPDTQTAVFLITIEQWNEQNITGDKLTFSIRKLLSNKNEFEGIIEDVNLDNIDLSASSQEVRPRGISGTELVDKYISSNKEKITVLDKGAPIYSPIDGVTLTGIGYINNDLHIQICYRDILNTDNHGTLYLLNKETGESIPCSASVSFFGDTEKDSYEDYIFTGISAEMLDEYVLYGDFVTSSGTIEGNWSVTFPLK